MSKLLVVFGVTGTQGASVASFFAKEQGWKVRGVTPDLSKVPNQLVQPSIELVEGDLDRPASLSAVFNGATAVFGVTDFWQFAQDPKVRQVSQQQGISINQAAFDREYLQGKNLVDAVAKALSNGTIERFVLSTLSDSKKWSNGKITNNYQFDAKAKFTEYLKTTYPELVERTTYLQMGIYMTNHSAFTPKRQPDGNYVLRVPHISSGQDKPMPYVHADADTGYYVRALLSAPAGTTMLGYSSQATREEYVALWTRVLHERGLLPLDKECRLGEDLEATDLEQLMPGGLGTDMYESMVYAAEFGVDGGDPEAQTPEQVAVQVEKLTTLEGFMRNEDWSRLFEQ